MKQRGDEMKRAALFEKREKQGLSQSDVAKKAGINRSFYGLIENGKRNPTLKVANNIANALGSRVQEIFPNEFFFANKCYDSKQLMQ